MYVLEYLIYHLRPFGTGNSLDVIRQYKSNSTDMLKAAYAMSISNMGADDAFKKTVENIDAIMNNSSTVLNPTEVPPTTKN